MKNHWHRVSFLVFEVGELDGEEGFIYVMAHNRQKAIQKALSELQERNQQVGIGIISVESFNPNYKIDFRKTQRFNGPSILLKGATQKHVYLKLFKGF